MRFERVGLVWLGDHWRHLDAVTYLALLPAGGIAGVVLLGLLWRARGSDRAVWWTAGIGLSCAAVWRTIIHPPSGDEPSMLLAAWQWLRTGSADLSRPWDPMAAEWSRAVEFRDRLILDHAIGPAGGPLYTFHGVLLPAVFGWLLFPAGRFGLALALAGLSLLAARWTRAMVRAALGTTPSPEWLALILIGSPVAAYTIFTGPELWGAALFALGAWGLAARRPGLAVVAVAALPWIHHKDVFPAAGLVLAAWTVSPGAGAAVTLAALTSGVPEMLWVSGKIGLPLWSPAAVLARHATYGAAWSPGVWLASIPGLLADRWAGLVWFPACALAPAGCAWLARRGSRGARAVLLASVPYAVALLTFSMWTGGNGAPGRQLATIFPALALGAAVLDRRLAGTARGAWRVALWAAVAHGCLILSVPPLAFESAKLKIAAAVAARIGFDPLALFPAVSKLDPGAIPGWGAAVWVAAILLVWVALYRRLPRKA